MQKMPNDSSRNEEPPLERPRILSELVRASIPAIYCRSWVPYLRILLLIIVLVLLVAGSRSLLAGGWLW